MEIFRKRLREAIDETCRQDGLTQEKLADEMGIGRTTFRNYFDRAQKMPIDKLVIIADRLGRDINWLCGRDTSPEWPKRNAIDDLNRKMDRLLADRNN